MHSTGREQLPEVPFLSKTEMLLRYMTVLAPFGASRNGHMFHSTPFGESCHAKILSLNPQDKDLTLTLTPTPTG